MKILVCEDDLITLKALEYSLKKEGYTVYTASDGKEGADLLRENIHEIDLMITDHHMPYFSGLELVHLVRNELKDDVPIIMLTRVNMEELKKLAKSLGVNDYITKPFFPGQLLLRMKCMLNKQSQQIDE
jgi:two-component system, OmpR family, response regulator VicR